MEGRGFVGVKISGAVRCPYVYEVAQARENLCHSAWNAQKEPKM